MTHSYSAEQRDKLREKGARYFMFREDFLDITTMEGAVVLQKLLNFSAWRLKKAEAQGKDYDGWFAYTSSLFAKHLRVGRKVQYRILDLLSSDGYIQIKRGTSSKGSCRLVWIDVDYINEVLTNVHKKKGGRVEKGSSPNRDGGTSQNRDDPLGGVVPKSGRKKDSCNKKDSSQEQCRPEKGGSVNGTFFPDEEDELRRTPPGVATCYLHDKLKEHHLIMNNHIHIPFWRKCFEELFVAIAHRDGLSPKEILIKIKHQIDLHVIHIHDQYWPKCRCAKTFCARYQSVEDAIVRLGDDEEKKKGEELRKKMEAVIEESGFRVTTTGKIQVLMPHGIWKTIPYDEEDNYPVYIVTREHAQWVRDHLKS